MTFVAFFFRIYLNESFCAWRSALSKPISLTSILPKIKKKKAGVLLRLTRGLLEANTLLCYIKKRLDSSACFPFFFLLENLFNIKNSKIIYCINC